MGAVVIAHTRPPRMTWTRIITAAVPLALVVACTAAADGPSSGTYTVRFPSTSAAVATDTVQLFVFEPPASGAARADFCQSLIQSRKRKETLRAIQQNQPVNICELLAGKKPVTIAYGEKAILAVAQRKAVDFMAGCVIQTLGDGDAPSEINLSLLDVSISVPDTTCSSVTEFCTKQCPAL